MNEKSACVARSPIDGLIAINFRIVGKPYLGLTSGLLVIRPGTLPGKRATGKREASLGNGMLTQNLRSRMLTSCLHRFWQQPSCL